jgi:hypothetical protein
MYKFQQKNKRSISRFRNLNMQNVESKDILFSRHEMRIPDPTVRERIERMSYIEALSQTSSLRRN